MEKIVNETSGEILVGYKPTPIQQEYFLGTYSGETNIENFENLNFKWRISVNPIRRVFTTQRVMRGFSCSPEMIARYNRPVNPKYYGKLVIGKKSLKEKIINFFNKLLYV